MVYTCINTVETFLEKMIFHVFWRFWGSGSAEWNFGEIDGWIGSGDGLMTDWGWFWTEKYRFYSIILANNTLWTGRNTLEPVLRIFIFHDFKDFSGILGIWCRVLVSPTGIDTFFCDRKMDRSRSSGGVGRCPAACYVGRCIVQVACATFGDVLRAPKNFNPDDTFFCALFP